MTSFSNMSRFLRLSFVFFVLPAVVNAGVLVSVSGKASPYLAGMPNGSALPFGDTAPAQSPVLVSGIGIFGGALLQFDATGSVSYNNSSFSGPDGSFVFSRGSANGISGYTVTANALLGVFLGSARPDLSAAPNSMDFSTDASRLYQTLTPELRQVFFIGDGIGAGGVRQTVIAPAGASRLFLGTADGSEWNNNGGSFAVTVSSASAVPEASATVPIAFICAYLMFVWFSRRPLSRTVVKVAATV